MDSYWPAEINWVFRINVCFYKVINVQKQKNVNGTEKTDKKADVPSFPDFCP
jgi:hypothetical protein